MSFSLIIPVYNEEKSIKNLFEKLKDIKKIKKDIEIILIDDCSTDRSYNYLSENCSYVDAKIIKNEINRGYGFSIKEGLKIAKNNSIAICDCDGTYPVEEILKMFEIFNLENADMVIGKRDFSKSSNSIIKNFGRSLVGKVVNKLTNENIPDFNSGLRIFKKKFLMEDINLYPDGFSLTTTLTILMKLSSKKVVNHEINYLPRIGKSKIKAYDFFRFLKLILYLTFYFKPFKILLPINIIFALGFFVSLIYDIINLNLTDKTLLFLFISINMAMLSFIVEMIVNRRK
tara:strand:- start:103 stop:963 length:861 start_codon:yes stop_codon:yes gene_type:complete